jgi:hypothetical protein
LLAGFVLGFVFGFPTFCEFINGHFVLPQAHPEKPLVPHHQNLPKRNDSAVGCVCLFFAVALRVRDLTASGF